MPIPMEAVIGIIEETAAAEVMPRFRALAEADIRKKRGGEVVTVADEAAERVLARRLAPLVPGSLVLGEEATAADPARMDALAGADPVWIIDPIDGTSNFARGVDVFVIMVGLVRDGETLAGWIHDPIAGRTATAEAGAGAWLGARRLAVAQAASAADMRGTLHAGTFAPPEMVRQVQARRERVGAIKSLRCAGREYLRLATAETHFALFTKLMPWDHVPGSLIQREAGGVAQTLDGAPYGARSYRASGLLLAPDPSAWQAIYDALF